MAQDPRYLDPKPEDEIWKQQVPMSGTLYLACGLSDYQDYDSMVPSLSLVVSTCRHKVALQFITSLWLGSTMQVLLW